jgi:hypothetical protein
LALLKRLKASWTCTAVHFDLAEALDLGLAFGLDLALALARTLDLAETSPDFFATRGCFRFDAGRSRVFARLDLGGYLRVIFDMFRVY